MQLDLVKDLKNSRSKKQRPREREKVDKKKRRQCASGVFESADQKKVEKSGSNGRERCIRGGGRKRKVRDGNKEDKKDYLLCSILIKYAEY